MRKGLFGKGFVSEFGVNVEFWPDFPVWENGCIASGWGRYCSPFWEKSASRLYPLLVAPALGRLRLSAGVSGDKGHLPWFSAEMSVKPPF
jgi:hypothetical protein